VKDILSVVDCSYKIRTGTNTARDDRESLDGGRVALSMTVDEIDIMNRWGQAARSRRRKKRVEDNAGCGK